jgi:MFS family permease
MDQSSSKAARKYRFRHHQPSVKAAQVYGHRLELSGQENPRSDYGFVRKKSGARPRGIRLAECWCTHRLAQARMSNGLYPDSGIRMKLLTTQDGLPRLSWGSVIAGVILSSIVYLIMSVLGTAIGASLLSPLSQPNPLHGFGFGSGVWVIVTTVLAVFIGSYFAGRCAPVLGWLHGLLSWAVMTLLIVFGMTSLIGSAVSTVGSVAATSAQVGATAANQTNGNSTVINSAMQQLQAATASAASAASNPEAQQDTRQAADTAARGVARASWFSFAALIVGAIIAIVSGGAGFRHQPPFEDAGGSAVGNDAIPARSRVTRPPSGRL